MPITQVRRKLSVYFVVITLSFTALMAVMVTGLQIYLTYKSEMTALRDRFDQIEKSYIPSLKEAMWAVDEPRINVLLNGLAALPGVGDITLLDDIGTRWQRNNTSENQAADSRSFTLQYHIGNDQYLLGELQVTLMDDAIYQSLKTKAVAISITTCLSLLVAALILLYLFRHAISRHLENMARYAATLDSDNMDQPLSLNRPATRQPDELDMVVEAINKMRQNILDDLNKRTEIELELIRHRQDLEKLVSERTKELEQNNHTLQQQSAELSEQNAELNAYAHTVAHDLKHPLTALLGQTALLQGAASALSEQQRRSLLQSIHSSAEKMNTIINALLMLASVRRTDNIATELLDIKAIATSAAATLSSFASEHNANFRFTEYWPKATGFSPWLEQVWVNYISNAIKYGGEAPTVVLGANELSNGQIRYWVKDSGPGIALEKQTALFAQFNRLDTKKADGHGLGLSIVARIVQRLGGETGYEAPPDGGSLFWFSLPAE